MDATKYAVGDHYFEASLTKYGHDLDDATSEPCATREEAEREGQEMVAGYDSEWQKKHPDAIDYYVTEFVVVALDDDGTVSEAHGV